MCKNYFVNIVQFLSLLNVYGCSQSKLEAPVLPYSREKNKLYIILYQFIVFILSHNIKMIVIINY